MVIWPLLIYFLGVIGVVVFMIGFSFFLGERHHEHATGEQYESGIVPTATARVRFSIQFYLIAMFFVIFDLEAIFLVSWAVAARELGWAGYIEALVFTLVLLAALIYLWRLGALDWGVLQKQRSIVQRRRKETGSE